MMKVLRIGLWAGLLALLAMSAGAQEVLRSAEQPPQFPGGEAALMKCVSQHLEFPPEYEFEGAFKTVVQFVVTQTGEVGDTKVVRSSHPLIDSVVVNAVRQIPRFTPARQDGIPVSVWYTLPVVVRFQETSAQTESPKPKQQIIKEDPANGIFEFIDSLGLHHIEETPKFPKGEAALIHHITTHLQYPTMARESMIEGSVMVQFVVSETGEVGEPKVVKSAHPLLDAEALRVCRTLPKFTPGKRDGKPVDATVTVPVIFKLRQPKLEDDFH